MIQAFLLCHPQSTDIISKKAFRSQIVNARRIACGTTKVKNADLSESNDFFPTYASWNSGLFETSVILTIWEHADNLIGNDDVAIMHADIGIHFKAGETWRKLNKWLREDELRAIGLTAPSRYIGIWDDWVIPEEVYCTPNYDPFFRHLFDDQISVWEIMKEYDADIHDWAMDIQPRLIYSHQFLCTRATFDYLGDKLARIARNLRLRDIGFWTPHMFERLIALYLARRATPLLTTTFWHYAASGIAGPGEQSLYGPRPLRYYKVASRYNERSIPNRSIPS